MKWEIFCIVKRELCKVFGDKRLLFSTIILPGLMIYIIYSLLGNITRTDSDTGGFVALINKPAVLEQVKMDGIHWQEYEEGDIKRLKQEIQDKKMELLIIFPEQFDALAPQQQGEKIPEVKIFYNSSSKKSTALFSQMQTFLNVYEDGLVDVFSVNTSKEQYDLASEKDLTAVMISTMLPMLLMMFIFSGCAAIGPESIAGEKERGTLATLLVTPIDRKSIAIGKILALSFLALLSGVVSFIGTMASLPNAMGMETSFDFSMYSWKEYASLLLVILITACVMIGVVTIMSALSRNVKEAGTLISPLLLVIVFLGILPSSIEFEGILPYYIPVMNSTLCMREIFMFQSSAEHIVVTLVSNCLVTLSLTIVLGRIFESEKLIYTK